VNPTLHLGDGEMILRVVLAVVLGGAIGIEREINAQPAGFRTHVVLCLGAVLFGLISVHGYAGAVSHNITNVRVDVTRVASQVVVGVGFLGGGAILKEGGSVRGLTTAASLWVTAAIGLALGIGYYTPAVAVTVATLLSLVGLRVVRRWVRRRLASGEERVTIRLNEGTDPTDVIAALGALPGLRVLTLHVAQDDEARGLVIDARLRGQPGIGVEPTLAPLAARPDVDELVVRGG
jgi:putative Mg2+ transporter-C (MgtC) family protein